MKSKIFRNSAWIIWLWLKPRNKYLEAQSLLQEDNEDMDIWRNHRNNMNTSSWDSFEVSVRVHGNMLGTGRIILQHIYSFSEKTLLNRQNVGEISNLPWTTFHYQKLLKLCLSLSKPEKNRVKSKIKPNRFEPVFVLKNQSKPKPVSLNRFWFGSEFFFNSVWLFFLIKIKPNKK